MPRLLRAFAHLFIAFPGVLIWALGCVALGASTANIVAGGSEPNLEMLIMPVFGATGMILGYCMIIGSRILCNDPRERATGAHLLQRLGWESGRQITGVLSAAAVMVIADRFLSADLRGILVELGVLILFITSFMWITMKWEEIRSLWLKEARETEHAMRDSLPPYP